MYNRRRTSGPHHPTPPLSRPAGERIWISTLARKEIALLSNLETADVDVPMIERAIDVQDRWQINFWDALIIAAAERMHCPTVLSEDMSDGQVYGGVTVRNPFKPTA